MKLKYLGTAAAEGIPALFCDCRVCREARANGGKDVKTRSQAIVDDKILIDFPADTYMHVLRLGLDLKKVRTLIVTHSHSDHLYPSDFWCRGEGIANDIPEEPLNVYLTADGFRRSKAFMDESMRGSKRVVLHEIKPFEPFEAEGYRFIPLKADHDVHSDPVFYIIEKDDKTLLYANDTGLFPQETVDYLARYARKFDFVSLDCTGMLLPNWNYGHMGLDTDAIQYEKLKELGLCDDRTVVYVNHFSHNGKATHDELVAKAAEYGFGVSYDGCEVEF